MSVQNATLMNMMEMGVIENKEDMEWRSPFGQYIFRIKRYEPELRFGDYNYRIEINIFNNLGVFVTKLQFNEIDAVRIIDNINFIIFDCNYEAYSSIYIEVSMDTNLDCKSLYLQILPLDGDDVYTNNNNLNPIYYNNVYDDVRDIDFKILNYNPIKEQQVPIVNFNASPGELEELAFCIYFACLIDIDIPPEESKILDRAMSNNIHFYNA